MATIGAVSPMSMTLLPAWSLRSIIRPRTLVYFVGWAAIGLAMLTVLSLRSPLELNVLHDRNPLYVQLKDGGIRNGYDVKILNMTPDPRTVTVTTEGLPGAEMSLAGGTDTPSQTLTIELEPDKVLPLRLYIRVPAQDVTQKSQSFIMRITTPDGAVGASAVAKFEAPEKP